MDADQFLSSRSFGNRVEIGDSVPESLNQSATEIGKLAARFASHESTSLEEELLLVRESIVDQLPISLNAYKVVGQQLNESRPEADQIEIADQDFLSTELEKWLTTEKLAYVRSAQADDSNLRFILVATPNYVARNDEIIALARGFGNNQPNDTLVWNELNNQFKPEKLSGTITGHNSLVIFSLIPNKEDPKFYGTSYELQAKLTEAQEIHPFLKVPSLLEAINYWQTLRTQNNKLADQDTFSATSVVHFDQLTDRQNENQHSLYSCIFYDGQAFIYRIDANENLCARIAIGS